MLVIITPSSIAIPTAIYRSNQETNAEQIPLATSVKGNLVDPIIWTNDSLPQDTRAKIVLEETIYYSNGDVAIPNGSSIIVEVVNWNDAGFVTLEAIALLYEDRHRQLKQIELKPKAFLIRDKNNRLLPYQQKNSGETTRFLGNVLGEVVGTEARNILGRAGSEVSRTLRRTTRNRTSHNSTIFFVEENTPVSLSINSLINLKDNEQ